ncbi:hypothetical protein Cob_v007314 [Colletotrichum orbiculare MAFF 240422]|uniref:Uncharacterized protein n=1 Tax=Colletotrichum orbiculare (strain 104-T / ATCC 96160 / CBS 514.97 / LARS 414 / MAFF 240422) TaxID=1213857 RepID=A0A484FRL3_COLOR|nr:hypothetical protein Cob_v007314 [Colletotrichum orbiculare MAFF 240422]
MLAPNRMDVHHALPATVSQSITQQAVNSKRGPVQLTGLTVRCDGSHKRLSSELLLDSSCAGGWIIALPRFVR